jgi:hypothetical protein
MTKCVFACLKRKLGLLAASVVIGAILAIGAAALFLAVLTGGIAVLAAIGGAIGGAAVTIASCVNQCRSS